MVVVLVCRVCFAFVFGSTKLTGAIGWECPRLGVDVG